MPVMPILRKASFDLGGVWGLKIYLRKLYVKSPEFIKQQSLGFATGLTTSSQDNSSYHRITLTKRTDLCTVSFTSYKNPM